MNKTLALVLAVAAILGAVLLLFITGGQESRGGSPAATTATAGKPGIEDPATELARPDELAQASAQPTARTEAEVLARRDTSLQALGNSENFETDGARWVEVTVVLPAGVPADDAPALLSFSNNEGEELDRWERRNLSRDVDLAGDFIEEFDRDLAWARRDLTGSTTVRMPFHPAAKDGVVLLQSRYVFAEMETVRLGEPGEEIAPITIEGELGAYVTGVCVIPAGAIEGRGIEADDIDIELDGRPLEGGLAFAMDDSREPRIRDDFTFELRALSANKKYAIQASAEKLVDYFELSYTAEAGKHTVLEIPFELGGEIRGRVVGDDGQPIAGADVETEMTGMVIGENDEEAETAADGTFVISGLSAGKVEIQVEADGWREKTIEDLELGEGQILSNYDIVLERGNSITGVVRWADGSPAEEASVQASVVGNQGWRSSEGRVRTDEGGLFTLSGLGEGPFRLRAKGHPDRVGAIRASLEEFPDELFGQALGYIEDASESRTKQSDEIGGDSDWVALLESVAPNTSGVELVLKEPLVLSGFVKDDTGAPITTEFQIEARPVGSPQWGSSDEVDDDFETSDGSFHLQGFFPGEWMVTVEAAGYTAPEEELSVQIPAKAPVELVLLRGAAVAGVVLDPFGKPVAEASVVTQQGAQGNPFNFGRSTEMETDAEGRFALDAASPTGMSLVASHPDWAASEPVPVESVPGGSVDDVVLHLRLGAVITGEVFDENGDPHAGQNVTAGSQAMGGFGGGGTTQVTDGGGRFRFEHVTPGQVVVTAMPREEDIIEAIEASDGEETAMMNFMGQMRMERVEVKDGEEVHVVLGSKPKDPVKVIGRVTEAGSPLTGTQIVVIEEGGSIMEGLKATKTDANGRYEVTVDRPGDFVFNVDMEGGGGSGIPFFVDVPEQPEFEQDLTLPLGRISGRVTGPDGAPAASVPVSVSQMGGVFGLEDFNMMTNQTTNADGEYSFEHLTAGQYSLRVGGMGSLFSGDTERFGAVVVDDIEVKKNDHVDGIDVRLSAPGKLAGTVLDSAGKPVAGAAIFVRDSQGRVIGSVSTTMTDGSGRFTYGGLAPGAITVSARNSEQASVDVGPIDIVAGETATVELEVNAGTYVVVTLLDGDELVRARVQVTDENGRQVNGLITAEQIQQFLVDGFSSKERRIGPVPPGKYKLVATTAEGLEAKKTVTVKEGQAERKVKLRLK